MRIDLEFIDFERYDSMTKIDLKTRLINGWDLTNLVGERQLLILTKFDLENNSLDWLVKRFDWEWNQIDWLVKRIDWIVN